MYEKSKELYVRACKALPAGATSNFRIWDEPCTLYIKEAHDGHLVDVDGNEYIDYRLGFGPVILGHGWKSVSERIKKISEEGIITALPNELEIRIAERIKTFTRIDLVRFANSGAEATMHALRVARAYSGKEKIVKFEGQYHGMYDYMLFSTYPPVKSLGIRNSPIKVPAGSGIPGCIHDLVITQPWNDFETLEKTVKRDRDIAAIITEPVMGNCGALLPKEGYLKFLREICDEYDIILIFDEVKTGFRIAKGGAEEVYGVKPDMKTFAKALGNGYPIAAFGGIEEIMENIGPEKISHGGTFSGNLIGLTAADATLDELEKNSTWEKLFSTGKNLMKGIREILEDKRISFTMQGFPTMFGFFFTELEHVWELRDTAQCDYPRYEKMQLSLLKNGVMPDPDPREPWFLCAAHTDADLKKTLEAMKKAL
jgi:glutamate-1-semialdehyde 2,1-aminomutase